MIGWQAVFFDFDGVVLASVDVKTQAFAAMYSEYGSDVEKMVVEHHLANGGVSRFEKFRHYHAEYLGIDLDEQGLATMCSRFSALVVDKVVDSEFVAGSLETLGRLAEAGVPVYVASGTPQEEMELIVERKGLSSYFAEVHGSPRKKTEIVQDILSRKSFLPEKCLLVGDAGSDYRAAANCGLHFWGIVPKGESSVFPEGTNISSHVYLPDMP